MRQLLTNSDPVDQFIQIAGLMSPRVPPELTQAGIEQALTSVTDSRDDADTAARKYTDKIVDHVSAHAPQLPVGTIRQLAAASASEGKDPKTGIPNKTQIAQAAADKVAAALGFSGSLSLSSPAMLDPWARGLFGLAFVGACVLAIAEIQTSMLTSDQAIGLTVAAVATALAALILIMGYKNVTISASNGPAAGAAGAKGSAAAKGSGSANGSETATTESGGAQNGASGQTDSAPDADGADH